MSHLQRIPDLRGPSVIGGRYITSYLTGAAVKHVHSMMVQGATAPQGICSHVLARAAAGTRLGEVVAASHKPQPSTRHVSRGLHHNGHGGWSIAFLPDSVCLVIWLFGAKVRRRFE